MSQWTYTNCPSPKCGSSDAFAYKEGDEWGHCFSCGKNFKLATEEYKPKVKKMAKKPSGGSLVTMEEIEGFDTRGFEERQIRKNIAEHYGVKVQYGDNKEIIAHYYPYTKKGTVVGYKERRLPKEFHIIGDAKGKGLELFGQNVAAGSKKLIITEGELDAMAVSQAQYDKYQKFFPVVSIPSASQADVLLEQREFLKRFEEIYISFDNDKPGQEALDKAAKIIGFDKVKVVELPEKDASATLLEHGSDELMKCIFNARSYSPAGVVKGEEIWKQFQEVNKVPALPYPECIGGLNDKIKGMRLGEIVLFTSGTGSGKSTVIKEILLHIKNTTDNMAGLVSLEESVGDTAEKFFGMQLKRDLDEKPATEAELRKAYEAIFGDERFVLLDHQGSVSDDSLLDKIEHLALLGCKYIVLDHITIAVSEGAGDKTGNEAVDYVMSCLLKIVKKHNIWLGVISHLRKTDSRSKPFEQGHMPTLDDIKGSGSIKQISFDIIGFCRNMTADDEKVRNTIYFMVLKNRKKGRTGKAGAAFYDVKTTRLKRVDMVDFETEQ
jgi:twinkle protein